MRTHVVLPEDLVKEIDRIVGPRKRSQFIEEAVRAKLLNAKQREMLKRASGTPGLDIEKYPYWRTPEETSRWVRESRRLDNERLKKLLKRLSPE